MPLGSPYFYLAMFTRLITSIVIDADRTDTACFEDKRALPQRRALDERKEMWKKYLVHYESQLEKLQEGKKTSSLDPYRGEISRACAEFDGGEAGIFRLVVPCGAGKTLAALRYALHTARRYGKERIFYIAPFNSILEQNATEIAKFIGDPDAVLEHHSNIIFSAEENKDKSEDEKRYQLLDGKLGPVSGGGYHRCSVPEYLVRGPNFLHTTDAGSGKFGNYSG